MADVAAAAALEPFDAGVRQAQFYRSFLVERLAAEERYAQDLQRVLVNHRPDAEADASRKKSSGKKPPPPPRLTGHAGRAWAAMFQAEQYEAVARLKRVGIVRSEALARLDAWCKNQDRALENLRNNLQASVRLYLEARNKRVPDAKKAYDKRCNELDELVRQEEAVKMQHQLLSERPGHHNRPRTSGHGTGDSTSLATSPPHHGDADDAPDKDVVPNVGSIPGEAPRPFPKLFESFGHRSTQSASKKSNLFSLRPRPSDTAIDYTPDPTGFEVLLRKKTKVQREVEELDVQYRNEVIKLETLRLSVVHFLKMAQEQCLAHRAEMGVELVQAWSEDERQSKLLDEAVRAYRAQMEQDTWGHRANIQKDVLMVQTQFPSLQVQAIPYHNHKLGEVKDLLFGVKLMDYASSHNTPSQPPLLVQKCVAFLDAYALDFEGLYRISGKLTAIQALARKAEQDEKEFTLSPEFDDPSSVAGLLKRYLRELPDPLLPLSRGTTSHYLQSREAEIEAGWPWLRKKIRSQPLVHQVTLKLILEHLARVDEHSEQNKMPASNLALVLGPVIFNGAQAENSLMPNAEHNRVMEDLILFGRSIFEDIRGSHCPFPPTGTASSTPRPVKEPEEAPTQTEHLETGRAPWRSAAASAGSLVRRGSEVLGGRPRRALTQRQPRPSSLMTLGKLPTTLRPAKGTDEAPEALGPSLVPSSAASAQFGDSSPTSASVDRPSPSSASVTTGPLHPAATPPPDSPSSQAVVRTPIKSLPSLHVLHSSQEPQGAQLESSPTTSQHPVSASDGFGVPQPTTLAPGTVHRPIAKRPPPPPTNPIRPLPPTGVSHQAPAPGKPAALAPHVPSPLQAHPPFSYPPRLPPLPRHGTPLMAQNPPVSEPARPPLPSGECSGSRSGSGSGSSSPEDRAYAGTLVATSHALLPPSPVQDQGGTPPHYPEH